MQINGYLSRETSEQGAALTVAGNRITTSDTIAITLINKRTVKAAVDDWSDMTTHRRRQLRMYRVGPSEASVRTVRRSIFAPHVA